MIIRVARRDIVNMAGLVPVASSPAAVDQQKSCPMLPGVGGAEGSEPVVLSISSEESISQDSNGIRERV